MQKDLIELDLSDNAFGPAGARPLMRLLVNNRNIRTLKLNNNGLGIEGGRLVSVALIEAHEKNQELGVADELQVIIAGRNRMESPGVGHIAKALQLYSATLIRVQMPQNSIRPDGILVLMTALASCTKLEHLDLQDNTFTEPGSLALANVCANWPILRTLHVGDCLLSAKGGVHVIKALTSEHTKLENLHLGFNEINESGAMLVGPMLRNKSNLTRLELNGNVFLAESPSVDIIRQALENHGHPDALDELDEMESEDEEEESDEEHEQENDSQVDELAGAIEKL